MKKIILLIVTIIVCSKTFSQVKLDSLFNSIDSLTLIHVGFTEPEHNEVGFYQSKCYESAFHFSTNSAELILDTFKALDFKESSEIYFCGFDYKIQGFKQQEEIFEMDYNSECNYAKMGRNDFKTDTLYNYEGLKKYLRFGEATCVFRTTELKDCYLETLKKDQRIEIITLRQDDDLNLFYRFKKTIANN
jgi:hypothetical protein